MIKNIYSKMHIGVKPYINTVVYLLGILVGAFILAYIFNNYTFHRKNTLTMFICIQFVDYLVIIFNKYNSK